MSNIQCANPKAQYLSKKDEIDNKIAETLNGNSYILGENVKKLEEEFSEFISAKYSVGVANGTDAIEIALRALEIGPGDEVITVSHTATATVSAILCAGAIPVLVDVDEDLFTIDHEEIKEAISVKTKAIIAVHLYGQSCALDEIQSICDEKGIYLIEDVSQAHGAFYKDKRLGSIGHIGTFSCYPTKNLGAIGDAGLITTNNKNLYEKMNLIREYGWKDRISQMVGRNSRLDEIQAAVLRVKLKYLDEDNSKRKNIANLYNDHLAEIDRPSYRNNCDHVHHLYVLKTEHQDELIAFMKQKNIFLGIHYPYPVHMQKGFKDKIIVKNDLCITEKLCQSIVSLPIYPELESKMALKVIKELKNFDVERI